MSNGLYCETYLKMVLEFLNNRKILDKRNELKEDA